MTQANPSMTDLNRRSASPSFLHMAVDAISEYFTIKRTVRELSRLSDHELRDIGLDRSMIFEVAKSGR